MATTSVTYAAHRTAGLCGFCATPSVESRCAGCLETQNKGARRRQWAQRIDPAGDRRRGGRHARSLGWALALRRV